MSSSSSSTSQALVTLQQRAKPTVAASAANGGRLGQDNLAAVLLDHVLSFLPPQDDARMASVSRHHYHSRQSAGSRLVALLVDNTISMMDDLGAPDPRAGSKVVSVFHNVG
jgi:predicted exporter